MRRLLAYLKPHWKVAFFAPLLMVVEVICDLSQPVLLARIVDQGIAKGNPSLVLRTGVLMVVLTLVGMVGGIGCTIFASSASQGFGKDLRKDLFRKVLSFSFATFDRFSPGTLITRLTNDVTQLQNVILATLRIVVRAPLLFLGGMVMAIIVAPQFAPFTLVAIALEIAIFLVLFRRGVPLFTRVQERIDRLNTIIRENLAGIRVIRAFMQSSREKERFFKASQDLAEATVQAFLPMAILFPITMLIMNLTTVTVLEVGGRLVITENMEIGSVMALTNYVFQILFSLLMIGHMLTFLSRASASGKRIIALLEQEQSTTNSRDFDTTPITRGEVIFTNVSFAYNGEPVLFDISFVVHPGETIAVVGTTGSGKSTLLYLIPRFFDPSSGSIVIDGVDIRKRDLQTLREAIGFVFQEPFLFSGTIEENIRFGKEDASLGEVMEAARIAQIHEFIMSLPEGYSTPIGARGVTLSGGQKQRLTLARAILRKPTILLLDNCTSAVDAVTEQRILEELRKLRCTKFIVTQRITTVTKADHILLLDKGRLAAFGTHEELLAASPLYREMCSFQVERVEKIHA
ncbi:MAG: ABC transporter ATP-binding protein/permease [Candidatus Caldatribacterium sp.]|uniref:ABC transporter ATP-binding protein n=1 Tax=Candidatus Caldatribacterium sp. TaxID=2282143 RepID=UPI0029939F13|nr:ABC transporter ATP-binding protein/permease [Candidatus Caldatribacterium sp.]MCX7731156.1 ABC transporter ATP-binding protein/permease [Candidatus Caldatribacterium sp.]MDW8080946.1 ABC transporter ATP-binding protein [Candidatus Calescibacterium sp.]